MSLVGRVNLIIMSVLAKFLSLFQYMPILLPKKLIAKLEKSISTFVWGSKPMRMHKKILQLPKQVGGPRPPQSFTVLLGG